MKKIFTLAVICCMVALSGIAFSSCKPEEKGDYFFSIKLDPASVDEHLDSYNVLVYPKMFDAMAKDAKESFPENGTLIFSGEKSQVMKTVKKSFQNAAKSIEDGPNYNQIVFPVNGKSAAQKEDCVALFLLIKATLGSVDS